MLETAEGSCFTQRYSARPVHAVCPPVSGYLLEQGSWPATPSNFANDFFARFPVLACKSPACSEGEERGEEEEVQDKGRFVHGIHKRTDGQTDRNGERGRREERAVQEKEEGNQE
ncbi:hypothetical protein AOLI_G00316730 [Acnodon oligacanthus]